jgi:iron complex transport system substrate-binding protein
VFAFAFASPAGAQDTFVDSAQRTVSIPQNVSRVLAPGHPASVMLYTIAPDKMVGWMRAPTVDERPYLPERYRDLPAHGRLTNRGNDGIFEVVAKLKPDVIVDVGTVNEAYKSLASDVQLRTGIPYALIDGALAKTPDAYRLIGSFVREPARAAMLADYAANTLVEVARRVATVPADRRPRVYYAHANFELLQALGAVVVTPEQADVVVTQDRTARGASVIVAPSLPFGWLDMPAGVNRLIGLRWLAAKLYPALFPEDLRPIVRDFYTRFYGVALSDEMLERLLFPPS